MGEFEQLCKPETKSRVCITVENSPNPSNVYIRLCKHRKNCFYKITSSKNYNAGKDKKKINFTDQNVPSYNIDFTIGCLNWPMKTYISKSGDGVFTTRVSLRHSTNHTTTFTYSNTPLSQSERAYYLSYFIDIFRTPSLELMCMGTARRQKKGIWSLETQYGAELIAILSENYAVAIPTSLFLHKKTAN